MYTRRRTYIVTLRETAVLLTEVVIKVEASSPEEALRKAIEGKPNYKIVNIKEE